MSPTVLTNSDSSTIIFYHYRRTAAHGKKILNQNLSKWILITQTLFLWDSQPICNLICIQFCLKPTYHPKTGHSCKINQQHNINFQPPNALNSWNQVHNDSRTLRMGTYTEPPKPGEPGFRLANQAIQPTIQNGPENRANIAITTKLWPNRPTN